MNHRFCTPSCPQSCTSSCTPPQSCTSSCTPPQSCTSSCTPRTLLDILTTQPAFYNHPPAFYNHPPVFYNHHMNDYSEKYKTFILHDKSKLPPISEVIFPHTWKYSNSLDSKLNKYIEDNFTNGNVKYFDIDSMDEYAKYIYIASALTNKPLYRPEYIPVAMANESIVVLYCEENSEIYHMDLSKIEWPKSIPFGLFETLMEKDPSYYSRKVCSSKTVAYGSAFLHCASVVGILVLLYSLF